MVTQNYDHKTMGLHHDITMYQHYDIIKSHDITSCIMVLL